jgi:class III poly(R)-hydroxyalkanoic acid synthase PhaE subunit
MASGFDDFEQLARQYWSAWGDAMRAGATPAQPAMPSWNDALGWWSQLAKGATAANPASGADDAVNRFNSQAQQWLGQLQQLAAQFAGTQAQPADIADAWRRMLGANGANAFAEMFKGIPGPGQHGVDHWMEQMAPLLQNLQRDGRSWLGLPAFGFAREHQERWQALAQAQLDYQEKSNAYNALMAEATQLAFRRFEDKLAERSEPGRQLASARALFDLWIDAAEDAYAEIALSPRFRETYGEFLNAQMKVRAGLQREVEQYCGQLGIPTRTEIDAAHRKIVQLERELRRLRDTLQDVASTAPDKTTGAAAKPNANKAPTKAASANKGSAKKAPAKKGARA